MPFLSQKGAGFTVKDVSLDQGAVEELEKLGYMALPVTLIGEEVVLGFDKKKLGELLK